MKLKLLFLSMFCLANIDVSAQLATNVSVSNTFEDVEYAAIAFADVDGDADQDVLIIGQNASGQDGAKLYLNDGVGNFSLDNVASSIFIAVDSGDIAFADVDGDTDQDVLITGELESRLYLNNGSGGFTEDVTASGVLDDVTNSSVAFADVDGDTDLDLLITGYNASYLPTSNMYINDGNGAFTKDLIASSTIEGVGASAIAFADLDGDLDQDVVVTGTILGNTNISKVYTNDGSGVFSENTTASTLFEGVGSSAVDIADVDGDLDLDVLISGNGNGSAPYSIISKLYINNGSGNFIEDVTASNEIDAILYGSVTFEDIDKDMDQDILVTGQNALYQQVSKIYLNDGSGVFALNATLSAQIKEAYFSAAGFADVNGNGYKDLLITGRKANSQIESNLYNNNFGTVFLRTNATGANDGTSWADAYTNFQDAIDATSGTNKYLWVASGTYKPHATDRRATFDVPDGVKIFGGFNGTETLLSQRDPKVNVTVLSGDLMGNDNGVLLETEATRQDNSFHIVSIRGNAENVVLDGFTITGGNANGALNNACAIPAADQYYDVRGAAILTNPYTWGDKVQVAIRNCIIEKNTATSVAVATAFYPCGVQNIRSDIDFKYCIVRDNYSRDLPAILYAGSSGYYIITTGTILNCLFYDNESLNSASSIYLVTSTANGGEPWSLGVDVVNSTFVDNTGVNGNVVKAVNTTVGNSRFKSNVIYSNGSNAPFEGSTVELLNSISEGGQFSALDSDPLFTNASLNDYSLTSASPAIDGGLNNYAQYFGITKDLNDNDRIFNGTVDIGAYEYQSTLSTETLDGDVAKIKLYPNPTSATLNIKMTQSLKQATIYSILGTEVLKTSSKMIDVSNLINGMYLVKIESETGAMTTKRFIKQ